MSTTEKDEGSVNHLEFSLKPGFCIHLKGPGRLKIVSGTASLFGFELKPPTETYLNEYVTFPLETFEGVTIEYKTASLGHVVHRGLGIPQNWKNTALRLLEGPVGQTILVLGSMDSGKSSLINYLANVILSRTESTVAVVDTDVGQSKIGPPGTLGLGFATEQFIGLDEIQVESLYFVGEKSPRGNLLPIIIGLNSLIRTAKAERPFIILVDTTGFVDGPAAYALKMAKIEVTRPSSVIALQHKNEVDHLLVPIESFVDVLRLKVPHRIERISREDRIARRLCAWRSISMKSRLSLSIDKIGLISSPFSVLEPENSPLCEQLSSTLGPCLVSRSPGRISVLFKDEFPPEKIFPIADQYNSVVAGFSSDDFIHLYLGLLAENFETLGIGFIRDFDLANRGFVADCTVPEDSLNAVRMVRFGRLRVDPFGNELDSCRPYIVDPFD